MKGEVNQPSVSQGASARDQSLHYHLDFIAHEREKKR